LPRAHSPEQFCPRVAIGPTPRFELIRQLAKKRSAFAALQRGLRRPFRLQLVALGQIREQLVIAPQCAPPRRIAALSFVPIRTVMVLSATTSWPATLLHHISIVASPRGPMPITGTRLRALHRLGVEHQFAVEGEKPRSAAKLRRHADHGKAEEPSRPTAGGRENETSDAPIDLT